MTRADSVDVLVVGGGPTSLVLTSLLVRSGHKILTVEQHDKFKQGLYGRACLLYAGSLEMLDLMGIYDRVAEVGFIFRDAITYRDGVQSPRGWSLVDNALQNGDTAFKFCFSLRQKHLENALRVEIEEMDDAAVQAPVKLVHYHTSDSSDYPIIATIQEQGQTRQVHCKYLIGADGGRSIVRTLGNFHFSGTASEHKWVRLDAVVKTNMPSSRSHNISIESKNNGKFIWFPTDSGRTRIGFVYHQQGTKITEELIMSIAKEAILPFTLEFVKLDWWTVYEVGQRIAETFRKGPVFLAGDAAHTFSSGTAQGMNGGIHDAVNLGWKLAGVLSGFYHEDILDTYNLERRPWAERVIELDKDISALLSGNIPSHFDALPDGNPNDYLDVLQSQNAMFTTGIGISYEANLINRPTRQSAATIQVGHRAPDGPLYPTGRIVFQPLRDFIRYTGRFWILVFAGRLDATEAGAKLNPRCTAKYRAFRAAVDSPLLCFHARWPFWDFLTILCGRGSLPSSETLGSIPLGKSLYDYSGEVFSKYGVDECAGAVVVLRPDGIVSFTTSLDTSGALELSDYFQTFAGHKIAASPSPSVEEVYTGYEFDVEGEEFLGHVFKSTL
ncbi:putative 2,4-dichlorophenol 6-monooxygenase [Mycena vitilis]|nr:putative 2,4-dichlorophenol 6-monooxygenase [Mycena vitilis]